MLSVVLVSVSAPSAGYYIDSRHGSDSNAGDKTAPWRSLARLGQQQHLLAPGDSVLFAADSSFEGGLEITRSGASNAPITIKAYGPGSKPRFANPDPAFLSGSAIRVNASYVIVEGLFFWHCPTNPTTADVHQLGAVFLTTNATHCVVRSCEMTETPIGITVYGEHNLICGNFIHDNNKPIMPNWGPICLAVCGSHNEICHNRFENYSAPSAEYGHDGGAIEINDPSLPKEDVRIHHNVSIRNQGFIEWVGRVLQNNFAIHHNLCMDYQSFLGLTGPCTNFRVDNNTVVRTLAHQPADSEDVVFWNYRGGNTNIVFRNNIFVVDPGNVEPVFSRGELTHSYNLFYRTDHDRIPPQANRAAYQRKYLGGGAHLGKGDKIGDPLFWNPGNGNFRLRPGSPAIDAGSNLHYRTDLDGKPIPQGKRADIGAYEFSEEAKQ